MKKCLVVTLILLIASCGYSMERPTFALDLQREVCKKITQIQEKCPNSSPQYVREIKNFINNASRDCGSDASKYRIYFYAALEGGCLPLVKTFFNKVAPIDLDGEFTRVSHIDFGYYDIKSTPLFHAVVRAQADLVEFLISKGAKMNDKCHLGLAARSLNYICNRLDAREEIVQGFQKTIKSLVLFGANVNVHYNKIPVIAYIISAGNYDLVNLFISCGVSIDLKFKWDDKLFSSLLDFASSIKKYHELEPPNNFSPHNAQHITALLGRKSKEKERLLAVVSSGSLKQSVDTVLSIKREKPVPIIPIKKDTQPQLFIMGRSAAYLPEDAMKDSTCTVS